MNDRQIETQKGNLVLPYYLFIPRTRNVVFLAVGLNIFISEMFTYTTHTKVQQ